MNTFEINTVREIKARLKAKQPVSAQEKQMVIDIFRTYGIPMPADVLERARNQGFNVQDVVKEIAR